MGKRQRTPHFITGLGDGHVGRENSNNNQQGGTGGAKHGLKGFHRPVAAAAAGAGQKIHAAAATDDIFHVTHHTRRNNNNNNNNLPINNRYTRLRSATNERLARMDMDDGRESRWDLMFSSSSTDGTGKAGTFSLSNPMGGSATSAEQWQMSAIAFVGMIVFLSALFLHLVSENSSSGSSSGGGGGSTTGHHYGSSSRSSTNSKYHNRRIHRGGANKRVVSSGTRKKKTDEYSSDEEASDMDNAADGGVHRVDSDGPASTTCTGTPATPSGSTKNTNAALFYPYQQNTRHRKPSVTGHKETFAGVSYSPSAATAHGRNNYYLNPMDGPVMPYQSPGSSTTAKARLASSPNPYANTAAAPNSNNQHAINAGTAAAATTTPSAAMRATVGMGAMSPSHPQRALLANITALVDDQFVATGLESFHPHPPLPNDNVNGNPIVGNTTPQVQRRPHQFMTPKADVETDEESQHHHSSSMSMSETSSPHVPQSPGMSSPAGAAAFQLNRQPSYTHTENAYTAYGQMSFGFNDAVPSSNHVANSFNNDISSSSNNNNVFNGPGSSNMMHDSTHHHGNSMLHQQQFSNRSGTGMLSPRVNIDISELDETPRAGFARKTVSVMAQRNPQQELHQLHSTGSSSSNDPFHALRLPVVSGVGTSRHSPQGSVGLDMPFSIPQQQQQQHNPRVPFIPKLDLAGAAAMASSLEQFPSAGPGPPRSISVEELHLVQMESGTHWRVHAPAAASTTDTVPHLPTVATNDVNSSSHRQAKNPFHPSAGLGTSGQIFSEASSSTQEFAEDTTNAAADNARNSIVHKRPDITMATDAASSLRSSIKFEELKLEEVIGGGGFGQVWKAVWRGTPVAVKVLTGSAQAKHVSKAILEEFAAEINLLSGMRHPNVCLYMGACVDPPNRAIITELAANGSLWDALRLPLNPPFSACDGFSRDAWPNELYNPGKHGFPPSSTGSLVPPVPTIGSWPWVLVKNVATGAARGMAYLHSGDPPILHRDLKSANILLSESYTAKVCDFGLSRLKAQERSMTGNCGTVQWMAVEVLAQQSYGEKADVYSYGIICIELLTRECPYDGMSAIQCALAVLNRDQRPEIPRWCPPSLRALIKACIKKNPDERPTFSQIIAALDTMP